MNLPVGIAVVMHFNDILCRMTIRNPTSLVMIGIWVMIASVISGFITVPLGIGEASGVVFVIGMIFSWLAGIIALMIWLGRRLRSKWAGS